MFVAKEEFELVKNKHRAIISNQLCNNAMSEELFDQKLEEAALKECIQIKAEQMLAIQFGLEADLSFETFLKDFEAENAKRNKMLLRSERIYGPTQYTLEQYYSYINYNRKKALHREIIRRGMVEEEEILRFYEQSKERLYRKPHTYILQIYRGDQIVHKQWVKEIEINPENTRMYAKQYPELVYHLKDIQEEKSITLEDVQGEIYLIHCKKKMTNGWFELIEVKDNIKDRLARGKQEELVKQMINKLDKIF